MILIRENTAKGYSELEEGGLVDISFPNSKTRRGRVQGSGLICPTITASKGGIVRVEKAGTLNGYKVRRITSREAWRLMGYTDHDYEAAAAVNSESQLYKEAGNAIVKQVLMAIFRQMMNQMIN